MEIGNCFVGLMALLLLKACALEDSAQGADGRKSPGSGRGGRSSFCSLFIFATATAAQNPPTPRDPPPEAPEIQRQYPTMAELRAQSSRMS